MTVNKSEKGINVFFFTFPDYEYTDSESKYVTLSFTPNMPRFITLHCSENFITKEKICCWGIYYRFGK